MATLNQTLYNRSPFNIGQTNTVLWVSADSYEYVDPMVGYSTYVFLYPIYNERVWSEDHGEEFLIQPGIMNCDEIVGYLTDMIGQFWLDLQSNETIDVATDLHRTIHLQITAAEDQSSELSYGRQYHYDTPFDFVEEVVLDYIPYFEYFFDAESNELVSAVASGESNYEYACVLNVTLRPGQKLIIDAANYNVLLDGVNAIDCLNGEWLDSISRSTSALMLQVGQGAASNLSASVLFTERWL